MVTDAAERRSETPSGDDRIEIRLTIDNGLVDADVDPVVVTHGQSVRWVVEGAEAERVTLRFKERREAGVRLADAGLGPFARGGCPAPGALERSGASGFTLRLLYGVLVDGQELPWPDHPETGRPRNGGGIDVEVPPPGG